MADEPTKEEMAALAGYTVAYFNVSAEMKNLFNKAMSEMWEPARLQAAIRNTKWYKTTNQTERESWLLQSSDPAEYTRRLSETQNHVNRLIAELGFTPPSGALKNISINAMVNGWNDDQIRQYLGGWSTHFMREQRAGNLGGSLAQSQENIRAALRNNGINMTDNWIQTNLRYIMTGQQTEEAVMEKIRNLAAKTFPSLAADIKAGENVADMAEPYIQSMARILELNPEEIDLFDPKIRNALAVRDKDGTIGMKAMPDFEVELKKDPRWFKTNNARESMMGTAHEVLQLMGVRS